MEMTITEFLEARIAEDEKQALKHQASASRRGWGDYINRVLAECATKRAIIAEYDGLTFEQRKTFDSWEPYRSVMRNTLAQLAKVYQDHPDYRQEWAL